MFKDLLNYVDDKIVMLVLLSINRRLTRMLMRLTTATAIRRVTVTNCNCQSYV